MTGSRSSRPRRDLLRFDRSDRIGLVLVLTAAGLLSLGTWVVVPALAWATGGALPVPTSGEVDVPLLDAAGVRHGEADYLVHLDDASTGQWLLHLAPGVGFVVVLLCALFFAPVLRGVGSGDPFEPGNVRRLRAIGLLLLVAWPVLTVAQGVADGFVLDAADIPGLPLSAEFTLPVGVMAAGMVLGLLAEAFASGSRLREDVEGLV